MTFYIIMFLILLCDMFIAGTAMAKNYVDDKIHERELHISEYGIDKTGQKTVTVWAARRIFLPLIPTRIIYQKIPAPLTYDLVKTYGKAKFIGRYIQKRRAFVVTDEYLDIQELNSAYHMP